MLHGIGDLLVNMLEQFYLHVFKKMHHLSEEYYHLRERMTAIMRKQI